MSKTSSLSFGADLDTLCNGAEPKDCPLPAVFQLLSYFHIAVFIIAEVICCQGHIRLYSGRLRRQGIKSSASPGEAGRWQKSNCQWDISSCCSSGSPAASELLQAGGRPGYHRPVLWGRGTMQNQLVSQKRDLIMRWGVQYFGCLLSNHSNTSFPAAKIFGS